jgi:hypothetical protein
VKTQPIDLWDSDSAVSGNLAEFAGGNLDRLGLLDRVPSARRAWSTFETDRGALGARHQTGRIVLSARIVGMVLGAAVFVQCPRDFVINEAVHEHDTGMIKDHRVLFVVGRTQDSPDHLPIEP